VTHTISLTINRFGEPQADFHCNQPHTAWCRQNLLDPDDPEQEEFACEHPDWCWFTVLASGFATWGKGGIYDGPPHRELCAGEVEFTKVEGHGYPEDFCFWHYRGDAGGHEFDACEYEEKR
jgi:hypothetical protein